MGSDLTERFHAGVEVELANERAAALGRTGAKVEATFERCWALRESSDPDHVEPYRVARAELEVAVWELCVHREAIGMWDNTAVHRRYPIPPAR